MNTITDDQGNVYELQPIFDHDLQQHGFMLVLVTDQAKLLQAYQLKASRAT